MTRWLASLGLCCGLSVAVTALSAPGQRALGLRAPGQHPRGDSGAVKTSAAKQHTGGNRVRKLDVAGPLKLDTCQQVDRPDDEKEKRSDGRRSGNGRRSGGGPHVGGQGHIERHMFFVFDAVRRAGLSLELLPLLSIPEVQKDLQLDEEGFQPKLDAYMVDMRKRIDEYRQQAAGQPKPRVGELFNEHLQQENERFQKFLGELSQPQQDQLVYRFIQARSYRSLSNQLVEAKMGMTDEEALKIRQEIEEIREQTMDETRDRFRRIFDQGGGREQFEKIVRENQRKMDARIEKKLTDTQREKFAELRGKMPAETPDWLVRAIDFPFRPGPPRGAPRAQPTSQEKPSPDQAKD